MNKVNRLVTGHRGCGKSTELLRLKAELESQGFFTVYLDTEEILDLGEVDYLDVLLVIARSVEETLREMGMGMDEALLQEVRDWFADKVFTNDKIHEVETEAGAGLDIGPAVPFLGSLLASLTGKIKSGSSQRETLRKVLERELDDFIARINKLIAEARQQVQGQGHRDFVILVDGLEKMQYRLVAEQESTHALLFMHHAEQLKAPQCHIIYTVPVSLAFNANLGVVFPDSVMLIPMVKWMEPAGEQALRAVIARRVDIDAVFADPALLQALIRASGGAVRDLMRLVRLACEGGARITPVEVQDAVNTIQREYDRLLRNRDVDILRQVAREKRVQADEDFARLLNLRVILEYQNGNRWADLHPAVREIPRVRDALGSPGEQ